MNEIDNTTNNDIDKEDLVSRGANHSEYYVDENNDNEENINEENLNDVSYEQIQQLLNHLNDMVGILETNWNISKKEFKLTDDIMRAVFMFNKEHAIDKPNDISEEDDNMWDTFNGVDKMTSDDVDSIFGVDSLIKGINHEITLERIKQCANDLYNYTSSLSEYTDVYDSYMFLIDERDKADIEKLREYVNTIDDEDKINEINELINEYDYTINLDFLPEISDEIVGIITNAYSNKKTINYWMERSIDKLKKLSISNKVILELSQFEKRFLEEKYHKQYNLLLLYLLQIIVYDTDTHNEKNIKRLCTFINIINKFIRNRMTDEHRTLVLNNIILFENKFLDKINN